MRDDTMTYSRFGEVFDSVAPAPAVLDRADRAARAATEILDLGERYTSSESADERDYCLARAEFLKAEARYCGYERELNGILTGSAAMEVRE